MKMTKKIKKDKKYGDFREKAQKNEKNKRMQCPPKQKIPSEVEHFCFDCSVVLQEIVDMHKKHDENSKKCKKMLLKFQQLKEMVYDILKYEGNQRR